MNLRWLLIRLYLKREELKMFCKCAFCKSNNLPELSFGDLKYGDVINTHKPKLAWYDLPGRSIQAYQKNKWGKNYKDTHSVIYLGENRFFETTFPYSKYGQVFPLDTDYVYTVARYRHKEITSPGEREAIEEVCNQMNHTWYDVGQLLDFVAHTVLGYEDSDHFPIFDLGKKQKVCSVTVATCLVKCWMVYWEEMGLPRPLGVQHVEMACPADFVNHDTFDIIGKLKPRGA